MWIYFPCPEFSSKSATSEHKPIWGLHNGEPLVGKRPMKNGLVFSFLYPPNGHFDQYNGDSSKKRKGTLFLAKLYLANIITKHIFFFKKFYIQTSNIHIYI